MIQHSILDAPFKCFQHLKKLMCVAVQVAVVPPNMQGGARKKSSQHPRMRRLYDLNTGSCVVPVPTEVKVEPPQPSQSSTPVSYSNSRPGKLQQTVYMLT